MRDVNYGWLIRYAHANGASFFFLCVYIHIARGLYYGSFNKPRVELWSVGVTIFIVMMATAFLGYVSSFARSYLAPSKVSSTRIVYSLKWFNFSSNLLSYLIYPKSLNNLRFSIHLLIVLWQQLKDLARFLTLEYLE